MHYKGHTDRVSKNKATSDTQFIYFNYSIDITIKMFYRMDRQLTSNSHDIPLFFDDNHFCKH